MNNSELLERYQELRTGVTCGKFITSTCLVGFSMDMWQLSVDHSNVYATANSLPVFLFGGILAGLATNAGSYRLKQMRDVLQNDLGIANQDVPEINDTPPIGE